MSGGTSGECWRSRDWMPGPVQVVSLSSTEVDGGEVIVAGRVSDRVQRLVLDHGNGRTTTARVERGVFGLISGGSVTKNAELVSIGEGGGGIGRRRLLRSFDRVDRCYADPSGEVVYGEAGSQCLPAEPWTR
ncbi:hypothetical protein [Actinoplanes sp. NPDC049118]|uniref:hypothetical protein n=1 Tax=Actinoplanes sp. NPDC049118 TaxID=3155769 RepID=UPI0033E79C86